MRKNKFAEKSDKNCYEKVVIKEWDKTLRLSKQLIFPASCAVGTNFGSKSGLDYLDQCDQGKGWKGGKGRKDSL